MCPKLLSSCAAKVVVMSLLIDALSGSPGTIHREQWLHCGFYRFSLQFVVFLLWQRRFRCFHLYIILHSQLSRYCAVQRFLCGLQMLQNVLVSKYEDNLNKYCTIYPLRWSVQSYLLNWCHNLGSLQQCIIMALIFSSLVFPTPHISLANVYCTTMGKKPPWNVMFLNN